RAHHIGYTGSRPGPHRPVGLWRCSARRLRGARQGGLRSDQMQLLNSGGPVQHLTRTQPRARAGPRERVGPGLEGRDTLGRQYEGLARVDSAYQTAIIVTLGSTVHFKRTRNVIAGEGNKFVRRTRVDENKGMRVLAFVPVRRTKDRKSTRLNPVP